MSTGIPKIVISREAARAIICMTMPADPNPDLEKELNQIVDCLSVAFNLPDTPEGHKYDGQDALPDTRERDPQLEAALIQAQYEHPEFSWDRIRLEGRYSPFWELYPEYGIRPRSVPTEEKNRIMAAMDVHAEFWNAIRSAELQSMRGSILIEIGDHFRIS